MITLKKGTGICLHFISDSEKQLTHEMNSHIDIDFKNNEVYLSPFDVYFYAYNLPCPLYRGREVSHISWHKL